MVADQGRDTSILGDANTDWQDAIYQNGTRAIHNLTIEKGYDNTSIRASLGYNNEHGTLQRSGYERASLSLNVIQKLLDNKLKLTFTSQLAQEEIRNADTGAVGAQWFLTRHSPYLVVMTFMVDILNIQTLQVLSLMLLEIL